MKPTPEPPHPFRFGSREVKQIGLDGSEQWVQVTPTAADLLHPRKGYVTPQTSHHCEDRVYLANTLQWLVRQSKDVGFVRLSGQLGRPGAGASCPGH